jgi:hypothetical protein
LPDPEDLHRLRRFLDHADPSVGGSNYAIEKLPMNQQDDGYSCAVTVWDAIAELLFDAAPWTVAEKHSRRLEWFLFVALSVGLATPEQIGMSAEIWERLRSSISDEEDEKDMEDNDETEEDWKEDDMDDMEEQDAEKDKDMKEIEAGNKKEVEREDTNGQWSLHYGLFELT